MFFPCVHDGPGGFTMFLGSRRMCGGTCWEAKRFPRMRPYSGESTPSRPIWEVKHRQAQLVLR